MKVVGFTIIRNNILYDFGVLEAIYSIMPLCDLIVVAVGKSEDSTLEQIKNLDSDKIKIIEEELLKKKQTYDELKSDFTEFQSIQKDILNNMKEIDPLLAKAETFINKFEQYKKK